MSTTTIPQIPASRPIKDNVRRVRDTWNYVLDFREDFLFDPQLSTEDKQAIAELVHEELEKIRTLIHQRQNN